MAGQMVKYPVNGGSTDGYLATPSSGTGPGVIVIQEWWGLNDQVKGVADMLAREGFVSLAPDFYHGKGAKIGEPDQAGKLMMELQQAGTAAKDGKAAAMYLKSRPEVTSAKLGVIGFCMGGLLALLAAGEAPNLIGAVVDCYGVGASKPSYSALRGAAVLAIFGGRDHATSDALPALERELKNAGASFTKQIYPNADHAFLNEQRKDVHRPDDAKDAWSKIVPFLKSNVR